MIILGITHIASWNPAACILVDGELIAFAEEERYLRIKHAPGKFPTNAIEFCLSQAGITASDINILSIGFGRSVSVDIFDADYFMKIQIQMDKYISQLGIPEKKVMYFNHHICHAASTFPVSGYADCNILSVDGSGEDCAGIIGFSNDIQNEHYSASEMQKKAKYTTRIIPSTHSWGELWSDVTELLGFYRHSGEGKTMGLAPYGEFDSNILPDFLDSAGCPNNASYKQYFNEKGYQLKRVYQEKPQASIEPRSTEGQNLAYTLQSLYNRFLYNNALQLFNDTGSTKFSIAGGCGLNCSGNGHLTKQAFVNELYTQPASHDAGTALGSAALAYSANSGNKIKTLFNHAYWGNCYSQEYIRSTLRQHNAIFSEVDPAKTAATLLAENKVIGLFQGRAEIGPRALGNRSILANPIQESNLDRVNNIKGRESWRPLSPSILADDYYKVVDTKQTSPFMLLALPVREEYRAKIPAVVHVDGSCRPQTVSKETNPLYYELISEFKRLTGIPVVLNTSFNLSYEPIVNSPEDALKTFYESSIDFLIIGNFLVEK